VWGSGARMSSGVSLAPWRVIDGEGGKLLWGPATAGEGEVGEAWNVSEGKRSHGCAQQ
jgi:hypothetical protein